MPFTGNPGDGLSWDTAYEVSTKAQVKDIGSFAAGTKFKFVSDIDWAGGGLFLDWSNGADIDFNGFKVYNYIGISSVKPAGIVNVSGLLRNVWLDGVITRSSGDVSVINFEGGRAEGIRVDGSIKSNDGSAGVFSSLWSIDDPAQPTVSDALINASIEAHTGEGYIIGETQSTVYLYEILYTGTMSVVSGGTASLQFESASSDSVRAYRNLFWDATKNGSIVAGGTARAHGKTTTELQTLATYTETAVNTDLVTPVFDMVRISNYNETQTWTIADTDGVEYPKLGFQTSVLVPKATFTDRVGSPIQGGHVLWIEETAFDAANPSWNTPVIVSSTGTTDANGEVSYTGTVDAGKVYTAVLRDYNYVNGAWEKSQGSDTGQTNVDLTPPA